MSPARCLCLAMVGLVAGCGNDQAGASDPFAALHQACVDKINELRATESKPPLQRWLKAEPCADGQAQSDSSSGMTHGAFARCTEMAQNECPGWDGDPSRIVSQCLVDMWNEGPGPEAQHGHYLNMSSSVFIKVACGFYVTPAGKVWSVQDFVP